MHISLHLLHHLMVDNVHFLKSYDLPKSMNNKTHVQPLTLPVHQYEVSNFYAYKPSLHNLVYWHYEDYDGIGVSAHSLKNGHRYENTKSLTRYLEHHYLENDITLTESDQLFEKIMMGLRLNEGVSILHINQLYGIDFQKRYHHVIEKYQKMNLLEIDNGYLKTTSLGINYLNSILIDFLDDEQT